MIKKLGKIIREKNILSLLTQLSNAAIAFISILILYRSLNEIEVGNWLIYLAAASLLDQFRFGLTRTALVRYTSGENEAENKAFLGTSYKIGLYVVAAVTIVFWSIAFASKAFGINLIDGYWYLLLYYPLLALFNLSWNNAESFFQAKQNFSSILWIKLSNTGSFFIFLVINYLFLDFGIFEVLLAHLVSNFIPSFYSFIKGWDGSRYINRTTKETQRIMLTFGKYSMGTSLGSSLLRSADTFIIPLSLLGPAGVALYSIPLKLTDLLGIPLRSFAITSFPKMAKCSIDGNIEGLKKVFYGYSGAVTMMFVPLALGCYVFAEQLVWLVGGNDYIDSLPLLTSIFRIFALYTLLLPLDRFTGVALDSINRPDINFYKVFAMTIANVVGDLIAVFYFESLEAVAIVTVLFTILGIILGYIYLNKEIRINGFKIISEGISFFKTIKSHI